eukprot:gnl/TRDRNA2_/TRDRNA2_156267_c0_seq1.p1 gnl/TRDRNA2_/TRDRNA2_156267_c0~~gnl/TRDRNA2_/TRDRNA2_156267_c0_seq1.p1  ORF type:complete len:498 (+),score=68.00 gnl/TRDRNA2_/TRDRNA2_156267_c0_seq1:162-1496(+)
MIAIQREEQVPRTSSSPRAETAASGVDWEGQWHTSGHNPPAVYIGGDPLSPSSYRGPTEEASAGLTCRLLGLSERPWWAERRSDGTEFCILCSKEVTETHLSSEKHMRRVAQCPDRGPGESSANEEDGVDAPLPQHLVAMSKWLELPYVELEHADWGPSPWCRLCHQWVDQAHLESAKHTKRAAHWWDYLGVDPPTPKEGGLTTDASSSSYAAEAPVERASIDGSELRGESDTCTQQHLQWLELPFVSLEEADWGGQWPWCRLCCQWVDAAHLQSNKHQKRSERWQDYIDDEGGCLKYRRSTDVQRSTVAANPAKQEWLQLPFVEQREDRWGQPWPWCLACSRWVTEEHLASKKHQNSISYWAPAADRASSQNAEHEALEEPAPATSDWPTWETFASDADRCPSVCYGLAPLSPGWTVLATPDGQPYYYHAMTGTSQLWRPDSF